MYAAGNDHLEAARLLVDKGADVELKDSNGCTVMMYAQKKSNARLIDLLKAVRTEKGNPSQEAAPPVLR
jgi:ankyrin repeat protein